MNSRRAYKGPLKRQKFEYQCNICKNWFPEKNINVDHIIPAGSLNCANDLPEFVERLFVEIEGLQLLCSTCHDKKTKQEKLKN
jgi:5-methylcytosine-specific restriction endonuclease McrA